MSQARHDIGSGCKIPKVKFKPRIGRQIFLLSHLVQGYSRDLEASVASHICRLQKLPTQQMLVTALAAVRDVCATVTNTSYQRP